MPLDVPLRLLTQTSTHYFHNPYLQRLLHATMTNKRTISNNAPNTHIYGVRKLKIKYALRFHSDLVSIINSVFSLTLILENVLRSCIRTCVSLHTKSSYKRQRRQYAFCAESLEFVWKLGNTSVMWEYCALYLFHVCCIFKRLSFLFCCVCVAFLYVFPRTMATKIRMTWLLALNSLCETMWMNCNELRTAYH